MRGHPAAGLYLPRRRLGQGPGAPVAFAPAAPPSAGEPRPEPGVWREAYAYTYDFAGAQAVPAGTANALPNTALPFREIAIRSDADVPFELLKWIYVATDPRVYIQLIDDRAGRYLHSGRLDMRATVGLGNQLTIGSDAPGFFPYILPTPWELAPVSLLRCVAQDFSGAENTVRFTLWGAKRRSGAPPWQVDPWSGAPRQIVQRVPFIYPLPDDNTSFNIAANQSITFAVQTDSDSDFLVDGLMGVRDGAATVFLQDGVDRQRRWMDRATHIDCAVGNGVHPHILPAPRWVPARSVIQATIENLTGSTNQVRLYLRGTKVYYA